ncbi:hypothetical protein, partial [Corynebacterium striatum]|uniref:hypothetical protein n=1 Tax=Corynebacterium striatum TaxID=43770 RepID=UPI003B5B049B
PAKPDFASGLSPVNPRLWYQLTGNRQYHGAVTAVPTTRAQHLPKGFGHSFGWGFPSEYFSWFVVVDIGDYLKVLFAVD